MAVIRVAGLVVVISVTTCAGVVQTIVVARMTINTTQSRMIPLHVVIIIMIREKGGSRSGRRSMAKRAIRSMPISALNAPDYPY
jgi:hypothetical protein